MTDEQEGKERRQFPRSDSEFPVIFNLTLPIPVNMDSAGEEYPAVALDVSEGGIGLDVDRPLPEGAPVKLRFELLNSVIEDRDLRTMLFKLDGHVRHCTVLKKQHYRVGVQFSDLKPKEREFIATYIRDLSQPKT